MSQAKAKFGIAVSQETEERLDGILQVLNEHLDYDLNRSELVEAIIMTEVEQSDDLVDDGRTWAEYWDGR